MRAPKQTPKQTNKHPDRLKHIDEHTLSEKLCFVVRRQDGKRRHELELKNLEACDYETDRNQIRSLKSVPTHRKPISTQSILRL